MSAAIRTYEISVRGFPDPAVICARSAAKARARAYASYCAYDDSCTFRHFLEISTIRRAPDAPGAGERIMVAGLPATRVFVQGAGQYIYFMRDDSDVVLCAHPADVTPIAAAER